MKNRHLKIATITLIVAIVLLITPEIWAQCPMCRMTAESNLANGGTAGKGLNIGILFMLSLPYLIAGSIGYVWWRNSRRRA